MIVNLYLVTVMDGHPLFAGLDRNADEHARVVVVVAHLIDHTDDTLAHLSAGPVEQPHAAMGSDHPIFHSISAGANVLPSREIFSVEQLLPFPGLRLQTN